MQDEKISHQLNTNHDHNYILNNYAEVTISSQNARHFFSITQDTAENYSCAYTLGASLDDPALAEREAEVAIRLYGCDRIVLGLGPGPFRPADGRALIRLVRLCSRTGARLHLVAPVPSAGSLLAD